MKKSIVLLTIVSLLVCGTYGCGKAESGVVSDSTGQETTVQAETDVQDTTVQTESDVVQEETKVPEQTENDTQKQPEVAETEKEKEPIQAEGTISGYDAFEIVSAMTVGWNMGNCLDSKGDGINYNTAPSKAATSWGNEEPSKELFEAVKAAGFNTVRIPTTWYQHVKYDESKDMYVVSEEWMAYVKQAVDYAYDLNMFVILDAHHEEWANAKEFTDDAYAHASKMLTSIWSQVAETFKDYDQHLIFEVMNEPRQTGLGGDVEWGGGDNNSWKYVNDLNQVAVDAIRGQGSAANTERLIMLPGYGASSNIPTVKSIVVPENGGNIALSVHAYYPYFFAMDTSDKANHSFPGKSGWGENYETSITDLFRQLKSISQSKNAPIIIGECGASDFNNLEDRARWATHFWSKAKDAGIVCVLWDNQATYNGSGEAHGYISRKDFTWFENSIPMIKAIMNVYGIKGTLTPDEAPDVAGEAAGSVTGEIEVVPTEEYVKTLGRTWLLDDTLWMTHSATGAEFTVTGTKVVVTLKADESHTWADNKARVAVYVNNERVADEMMDAAEKVLTVFESETEETVIVKVVKLSESANSSCGISKIAVTGTIAPTENKDKLIEFIGDSITCGYGVDDEVKEHHFSTTTEDATKTYAYKTAEALGVDYSLVSFSGYGIISGYSGNGEKVEAQQLPKYYDKLGYSYGKYEGKAPQDVTWDFTKRQPDLVVINLGTNDNSYVKNEGTKKEEYVKGYHEFLKKVRECNPDATILCTLGIMGAELYPSIEQAVMRYQIETGDKNVYTMKFATQSWNDGYAADWHPTETTHTKAAEKLTTEIKSIMGW